MAAGSLPVPPLLKSPSGIVGLDEITGGGLPAGRPTLVCGAAGCGKTLFGLEFLARGALQYGEPGVLLAFEESVVDLTQNARSLNIDLEDLEARGLLAMDYVRVERNEIEETGTYDLDGLFIRLGLAIDTVGARRVVLDTIETLFGGLTDHAVLRSELRRLFRWLKEREVTAIITAERGDGGLTRHGLEEYVSDCVIVLDHRVSGQLATRRLRVLKYRGSAHGTNEYPFLIGDQGIDVLPVTSIGLDHPAGSARMSTGLPGLDDMLGGEGLYVGSSVLVSGTAGTGKSSLAAGFVDAACRRGERASYFAFEESPRQIMRNMASIGIDLAPHVAAGRLQFVAARPTSIGLETHLALMYKHVRDFAPSVVVVDPISNFTRAGSAEEVSVMLMRLVDFLKSRGTTALFTSLIHGGAALERTDEGVSSLIDTWILLRDIEVNGERNRVLHVLKSRGMAHSNQVREFTLTDAGIRLTEAYVGPGGVLTGSARAAQEVRDRETATKRSQEITRRQRELERRRWDVEQQVAALRSGLAADEAELELAIGELEGYESQIRIDRDAMAHRRWVGGNGSEAS